MKRKNIFWGIVCLALAVLIILSTTGVLSIPLFAGISTGKLIWTLILTIVLIGSLASLSIEGIIIPAGILVKMYETQLGISISVPLLIIVMILLIMASHLLIPFGKIKHPCSSRPQPHPQPHPHPHPDKNNPETWSKEVIDGDGECIRMKSAFNGVTKYINSTNFKRAEIDASFCGFQIYLNQAKAPSGQAEIYMDSKFSGIDLYIPYNWKVVNHVDAVMGAVEESPMILPEGETYPVELVLTGHTAFSGVSIKRI